MLPATPCGLGTCALAPLSQSFTASETKEIHGDISWLPDGRVVYQVGSAPAEFTDPRDDCDFWSMRVDVRSGKLTEKPKRLTNWPGFCIWNANVTADGKRLVFLRGSAHATIHVADLEASGARLRNLRHFTLDESTNFTQDWTNDSSSVIFTSNRAGKFGLYKQSLQADQPELLTMTSLRDTPATPDGKWILGITYPRSSDPKLPDQLLRIPLAGGAPEPAHNSSLGIRGILRSASRQLVRPGGADRRSHTDNRFLD